MLAIFRLTVHKLRTRWRGWAVLAVLAGLAGGVVMTAAGGALRTDSAYPRFLRQSHAADVLISPALTGIGVLGLARAQLSAVAFWQVSTVTAIALAIGVPLGIAGGRWAWQLFANQAGLPGGAVTPLPLLWMIPLTLVLAILVALPTAHGVARRGTAAALRSE
jgi:hypothetical protein